MQKRSQPFLEVGFYLSKFGKFENGNIYPMPPERLKVNRWFEAYRIFYEKLNDGRTVLSFERSLKNARDAFDSHLLQSGRQGWKTENQKPNPLTKDAQLVFDRLNKLSEESVWQIIETHSDLNVLQYEQEYSDLMGVQESESDAKITKFEGRKKAIISCAYERSPSLRKIAIEIHGTRCQACGFDFFEHYGEWGKGYIEVHHLQVLSDGKGKLVETNPKKDLMVLCPNCHRMIHRNHDKTLSLQELKNILEI